MAVVSATETFKQRSGRHSFRGDEYTRTFVVHTDSVEDDAKAAREAPTIPRLGDGHPTDYVYSWVHDITAEQREDSPTTWDVEVQYSTDPGAWNEGNPLQAPPKVRWTTQTTTEEFSVDENGVAVKNTANVPIDPAPTRLVSIPVCTVTRNEMSFDSDRIAQYVPSVNRDVFGGVGAHKVLMAGLNGDFIEHGYGGYWKVEYTLKFNLSRYGWEAPGYNVGLVEWRDVDPDPNEPSDPDDDTVPRDHFRIMIWQRDDTDTKIQVPTPEAVPLDWWGRKATPEFLKENGIITIHHQRYRWEDYDSLGLESIIRMTRHGRLPLPRPPR